MNRTVLVVLGAGFIIVGLVGLVSPHFMGAHLSKAHNCIHLLSGIIALYFGSKTNPAGSRQFAVAFGIIYALLGIIGFAAGVPVVASIHGMEQASSDSHLLILIPGSLVFGTTDHIMHLVIGGFLIFAGIPQRGLNRTEFPERLSQS